MEAKLKALKVVELKDILHKANVSIPAKANKPDLIAKIIASPEAVALVDGQQPDKPATPSRPAVVQNVAAVPGEDLLASSDEFDLSAGDASAPASSTNAATEPTSSSTTIPPSPPKPTTTPTTTGPNPGPASASTPSADALAAAPTPAVEDEETIRRRKRAERFGIPLVEPKQPKAKPKEVKAKGAEKGTKEVNGSTKGAAGLNDNPEKLKARAERFNFGKSSPTTSEKAASTNGKGKRAAPVVDEVDAEEQERRKKRALRFGLQA